MLRLTFIALLLAMGVTPATAADRHPAAETVVSFNQAVTARDMDTAMGLLADGGVQFNLHPAHPGMPDDPPLTEDMATMWKVVAAILFPSTEAYERQVEVTSVQSDGELATVWTQTKTITHRKGHAEPMVLEFSEMYFLVNKDGSGWRIAATATNRPVDSIEVG